MAENLLAQIRNYAFAKSSHEIETRRTGEREHRDDRNHDGEIAVDEIDAFPRETEIDHAAHSDRHDERRDSCREQGDQRGARLPVIAADIGQQRQQRPQFARARRLRNRRGAGQRRV